MLARVTSCLLGLLLVLQLVGLPRPDVRPADAKTIALAGLTAAIGQPVTLCDHGGPARPGDPVDSGRCEHCLFCHSVAVGFALAPVVTTDVARVAASIDVDPPHEDSALARARHRGGATPRGPPLVG